MDNDALKGKVVLVQFWATWCRYCRADQPVVDTLTREFTPRGLVVLAVDVGESREKVTQYLKKSPRACQVVLMEDTNLAAVFAAQAYPHYVVIDRDGRIVGSQTGAAGAVPLRRLLGQAGLGR